MEEASCGLIVMGLSKITDGSSFTINSVFSNDFTEILCDLYPKYEINRVSAFDAEGNFSTKTPSELVTLLMLVESN